MENSKEKTDLGVCLVCRRRRPLTSFRRSCGIVSSGCSECRTGIKL